MFGVDFSEMMVIAVVGLVVLGPEKLPRLARTIGALMGRMQRYVNDVKADINREIELDELKNMHATVKNAAQSFESSVRDTVSSFKSQADEISAAVTGAADSALAMTMAENDMAPAQSDADLADAIATEQARALAPPPEPSDADIAAEIMAAQAPQPGVQPAA